MIRQLRLIFPFDPQSPREQPLDLLRANKAKPHIQQHCP